jgi:hypothetical protein
MKDYLLLIRGGEGSIDDLTEERRGEHMAKWGAFMTSLAESENLTGGLPLTTTGRLLTKAGATDEMVLSKAEEVIGGYLMLRADNYDHALDLTKECPVLEHDGSVEIREAMHINGK